jgi:hypothetical protein
VHLLVNGTWEVECGYLGASSSPGYQCLQVPQASASTENHVLWQPPNPSPTSEIPCSPR